MVHGDTVYLTTQVWQAPGGEIYGPCTVPHSGCVSFIQTPYGRIVAPTGVCKDDYRIIDLLHRDGQTVKLQEGALGSYKAVCEAYAKRTWPIRYRLGRVKYRPVILTGSWRSCAYQTQLYASDPHRYAPPDVALHPRGLAVDVAMPVSDTLKAIFRRHGWKQARPDDEPWHMSYWYTG